MCQKLVGTDFKEGEDYELLNQLGEGGNGKVFNVKLLLRGKEKLPGISDLAVKMVRFEFSVATKETASQGKKTE